MDNNLRDKVLCAIGGAGVELGSFGEVGELLSEMGEIEKTDDPSKIRSTRRALDMPLARGHQEDGGRQQATATGISEVLTGRNCTPSNRLWLSSRVNVINGHCSEGRRLSDNVMGACRGTSSSSRVLKPEQGRISHQTGS